MFKKITGLILVCLIGLPVIAAAQDIDLIDLATKARWRNQERDLRFGINGREAGTIQHHTNAKMEDGKTYERVLFIHPPWKENGQVVGVFDNITLPKNDPHLIVAAGFKEGAGGTDGVTFTFRFVERGTEDRERGRVRVSSREITGTGQGCTRFITYNRVIAQMECGLEEYAGKTGSVIVITAAGKNSTNDWAALTEFKITSGAAPAATGEGEAEEEKAKQKMKDLRGHSSRLYAVKFSPDGKHLVTASGDRTARIWGIPSGKLQTTLRGHSAHVFGAAFSPNSKRVVTASGDGTARIWRVANGILIQELKGHSKDVLAAAFSPDGNLVATGSDDGTVKIWQAASGKEIRTFSIAGGGVYAVDFSPNGRTLAVGSTNGSIGLFRVSDGTRAQKMQGHGRAVYTVVFSKSGNRLVSAGVDNTVRVWNVNNGSRVQNFAGQPFYSAAYHPNGRDIVTGGDGRAVVWQAREGSRVMSLKHASGVAVRAVAVSPNGRYIALAGEDGIARVWEVHIETQK
jgi:WD40 repeat protein